MSGVVTASQPSGVAPFSGLSPRQFGKLVTALRREPGQSELEAWKEEHNTSHRKVRARVEHAFARMKTSKILRDCRLKGDSVQHACSASLAYNLSLAG